MIFRHWRDQQTVLAKSPAMQLSDLLARWLTIDSHVETASVIVTSYSWTFEDNTVCINLLMFILFARAIHY